MIKSNQTKIERSSAIRLYGINMKNSVDRTVPKREITNASDKRVRFLPTTTNPARYRTTAKTKKVAKNNTKEKIKRSPVGIASHHGLWATKFAPK